MTDSYVLLSVLPVRDSFLYSLLIFTCTRICMISSSSSEENWLVKKPTGFFFGVGPAYTEEFGHVGLWRLLQCIEHYGIWYVDSVRQELASVEVSAHLAQYSARYGCRKFEVRQDDERFCISD